jgi:hypothetical protein
MTLLYSEELGQAEKLRPYGLPPAEWLAWVAERLTARAATDSAAAAIAVTDVAGDVPTPP